jgi:hypothetical protein
MSLHIRQTPPPRLSVGAAMMWISLIALVTSLAVLFADHTPLPVEVAAGCVALVTLFE